MKQLSILDAPDRPRLSLREIRYVLGDCRRCGLCDGRRKIVFGGGCETSPLMLVGEGPGQTEDEAGEPFCGRSGRLLDGALEEVGLRRSDVYVTNVVKCRPPENRDPTDGEAETCRQFLEMQIKAVSPRVIVALGRVSSRWFLNLRGERGRSTRYYGDSSIKVFSTIHPAYALRTPIARATLVSDLATAKEAAWPF